MNLTEKFIEDTLERLEQIQKEMEAHIALLEETGGWETVMNGLRWNNRDFEDVVKACRKAYNEIETLLHRGKLKGGAA